MAKIKNKQKSVVNLAGRDLTEMLKHFALFKETPANINCTWAKFDKYRLYCEKV